jgi:hypothetical protein
VRVAHKYDDDFGHSGMSNSERSIPGARADASPARRDARDTSARADASPARRDARDTSARADASPVHESRPERASLLFAAAAAVPFLA